jgi:hypothetical protein
MADSSFFTHPGGELHLSNLGQLELLRGVNLLLERDVPFTGSGCTVAA